VLGRHLAFAGERVELSDPLRKNREVYALGFRRRVPSVHLVQHDEQAPVPVVEEKS
jgi:hypothetical protein